MEKINNKSEIYIHRFSVILVPKSMDLNCPSNVIINPTFDGPPTVFLRAFLIIDRDITTGDFERDFDETSRFLREPIMTFVFGIEFGSDRRPTGVNEDGLREGVDEVVGGSTTGFDLSEAR
jgi:hypothetical protein